MVIRSIVHGIAIAIAIVLSDISVASLLGSHQILLGLFLYAALVWSPVSLATKVFSGLAVIVLAPAYGYPVVIELLFVGIIALSAYLLQRVIHTSWLVRTVFALIFVLVHKLYFLYAV